MPKQICSRCNKVYPEDEMFFTELSKNPNWYCKPCLDLEIELVKNACLHLERYLFSLDKDVINCGG